MAEVNIEIANFITGIPELADKIFEGGSKFTDNIINAYNHVAGLNSSWNGKRYEDLVVAFNNEQPKFQHMTTLLCLTLPKALNDVAANYAAVNGDTAGQGTTLEITLQKLNEKSALGSMRFIESEVRAQQQSIEGFLNDAKAILDGLELNLEGVWKSDAASKYVQEYESLRAEVSSSVNTLTTSFTNLMTTALAEMQEAESNSTVTVTGAGGSEN